MRCIDGFAVHFFSRDLVERLADGFDLVEITGSKRARYRDGSSG